MKKLILLTLLILPLAIASCGSDNDEPNYSNQTLAVGSVYSIPGGSTGWTSDNELIASVSTAGVKAEHVGETYIRNGNKSFKVTVTPKYNTYEIPCLQFGASKSTVKSFMSGYTLASETDKILLYTGKYPVSIVGYSFTNSALTLSSVIIPITSVSMDELVSFMAERYIYVTKDEENNYFGFLSADKQYIIILQLETMNSQVVYFISYAKYTGSSSAPSQSMKMIKRQLAPATTGANAEVKAEYSRMLDIMPEMKTEYNTIK